ncbi:MAG: hypothetical protein VZR95_03095 [Alphaproteobacteria bacterium]
MIDIELEKVKDQMIKDEVEFLLKEFISKCLKLKGKYNHKIIFSVSICNENTGSLINIIRD